MGRDNSWQVEAPNVNSYMLYDMYKGRNIIPTGDNTLVGMLQDAWNTGKKPYKRTKILPQVPVEDLQKKSRLNERS